MRLYAGSLGTSEGESDMDQNVLKAVMQGSHVRESLKLAKSGDEEPMEPTASWLRSLLEKAHHDAMATPRGAGRDGAGSVSGVPFETMLHLYDWVRRHCRSHLSPRPNPNPDTNPNPNPNPNPDPDPKWKPSLP